MIHILYGTNVLMKRDILKSLILWKESARRKPLILRGARQVGKTWCLQSFGINHYQNIAYLNFEEMPLASELFKNDLTPNRIISEISLLLDIDIQPKKTLIIFDEIQACSEALNSLKYFFEKANEYHVVAAGSLLGVKLNQSRSFPVGKVNFLDLFPLSFCEFLDAIGKEKLRKYIDNLDFDNPDSASISEPIHKQLIGLLKQYTFIGGMPEVVKHYASTLDLRSVRVIQNEIIDAYLLDFSKHAAATQVMKITTIWNQIHGQLAKENKKFIFSAIRKSARGREYEEAILWLEDAGLIYKAINTSNPKVPIDAYSHANIFKIFLLDVGLLGALSNMPVSVLVEDERLFTEFKGAFIENLIATYLAPLNNKKLYYWSSKNQAEVDFIIPYDLDIYPLEVKAGISKKKKSLLVYDNNYNPPMLTRTTLRNLRKDGKIYNIPLYLMHRYTDIIKNSDR
jgi:predicted AAA+ superfamily ATPase